MLLFPVGSPVLLPVCGPTHRPRSDARTQHFRQFHVTAVSTTARQEDYAERHRSRRPRSLSQLCLDTVRNGRAIPVNRLKGTLTMKNIPFKMNIYVK